MLRLVPLICVSLLVGTTGASSSFAPWGLTTSLRGGSSSSADDGTDAASLPTRGGASGSSYASELEAVKTRVLETASESIEELRREIVNEATVVPNFGSKADTICNKALEDFAQSAPSSDAAAAATDYDRALEALEKAVDAPLQVLFLKQLALLREEALTRYRGGVVIVPDGPEL